MSNRDKAMVNFARAFVFLFVVGLCVVATAVDVAAQSKRKPTTTTTQSPRIDTQVKAKQPPNVQFSAGIYGKISWPIAMGFPSITGGASPAKELNCTAFRVQATVQVASGGPFGTTTNVGYFGTDPEPAQINGYYVCKYSLADTNHDFPHGRVITVSAFLGPYASAQLNQALAQGSWFGPGSPKPPAGSERVPVGSRGVTLTDAAPRATVDFVVEYRPLPSSPR
jgi:hypothetical protein